jgi:DNA (cytosine-5)-methyltransferase 1
LKTISIKRTEKAEGPTLQKYRLIDLFAGAGGMTLGFVDNHFCGRFEPVLAVDNDRASVETHELNFDAEAICQDIEHWLESDPVIPQADVVIGGPPCQGFSLLNKKRIGDIRRALWEPFLHVVERCGAKIFVMENVPDLLRSEEFQQIKERAEANGFFVQAKHINAAHYGAPQLRKRTIIVAHRYEEVSAPYFPPQATHRNPDELGELPPWKTVRDVIADLPKEPIGTEIGDRYATLGLHFGRSPTKTSLKRYRMVPPGGNRFDLQRNARHITPKCWIRKTSGGTDLFGRLWWDRPAVTIRTEFFKPEKGRYLHPREHRPITHREAARLMGFPDDFVFAGSKVEVARQIGNAVPPPLAGALARSIACALDSDEIHPTRVMASNRPYAEAISAAR